MEQLHRAGPVKDMKPWLDQIDSSWLCVIVVLIPVRSLRGRVLRFAGKRSRN